MRAKSFGKIAWFDHIMLLKHEIVKSCYFCLNRLIGFVMVSETGGPVLKIIRKISTLLKLGDSIRFLISKDPMVCVAI
jgi:hypothetical protein